MNSNYIQTNFVGTTFDIIGLNACHFAGLQCKLCSLFEYVQFTQHSFLSICGCVYSDIKLFGMKTGATL